MTLLPTANKTKLVRLLRAKGYDVPSGRQARFDGQGRGNARTFVLEWIDGEKRRRIAFYLTMVEVIEFGLVEEK